MARVALFTDEPVLAAGFTATVSSAPHLELVAIASEVSRLGALLEEVRPDILVVDMTPEVSFSLLAELHRSSPDSRIVLWARAISMELAYQVMDLGVCGILRKTLPAELVVKCLTKVAEGELWFDKSLTASFLTARTISLTNRESQLVTLLAQGLKNKEIATILSISEGTVKVYLSRLFQKVGVKDRFELALYGLRNLQNFQALSPAPAETLPAVESRSAPMPFRPLRSLVLERPVPLMRKPSRPEAQSARFAAANQRA